MTSPPFDSITMTNDHDRNHRMITMTNEPEQIIGAFHIKIKKKMTSEVSDAMSVVEMRIL